jgi:hypothetical protein
MIGAKHLTEETDAQALTHPGQAHFAIPRAKARCRECVFWKPDRKSDQAALCQKAQALIFRLRLPKVPGGATICKHFEAPEA